MAAPAFADAAAAAAAAAVVAGAGAEAITAEEEDEDEEEEFAEKWTSRLLLSEEITPTPPSPVLAGPSPPSRFFLPPALSRI